MSDYRRLVAYIYLYDKGVKVKNSGFAKIECRADLLKVGINLKGAFQNTYEKWRVYLLKEEKKKLIGVCIGDLQCKGQSADFKFTGASDQIMGTTISFEQTKGLMVMSQRGMKYGTFWEDPAAGLEDFEEYGKENKKQEAAEELNQSEPEEKWLPPEAREQPEKEEEPKEAKTEETDVNEVKEEAKEKNKEADIQAMSIDMPVFMEKDLTLNEDWERFLNEYARINPFAGNENIQCIKIELKDLRILPKSQWILGSNSFLLHGYYQYHYLLIGKIRERFIIGVPGVYCNKEKMLASMFGFQEFKPAQAAEQKAGRFGYWYKYL